MVLTNKQIYESSEFDNWAYNKGLLFDEKYLFQEYLKKNKKTIEAGTAGGRILFEMQNLGFTSLYGYDYLPELIEEAKKKDLSESICFEVGNATNLRYEKCSFEQIIYLQQILCFIDGEDKRFKAVKEAYRILEYGGIALFSFLNFEVRSKQVMYMPYLAYLRLFRGVLGRKRTIQELPWLKLGGKFNFSSLLDREPYVYWYKIKEAHQLLKEAGFEILAFGSSYQISQGQMCSDLESLLGQSISGGLYFVCTK